MPIQFLVSTVPVSLSTSFYAVFAFLFSSKSFLFNIPVYLLLSDSFCIPLFFLHSIFFIFPRGAPKRKYLSNRRNADTKQNLFSQVSSVRLDSPAPALFLFFLSLSDSLFLTILPFRISSSRRKSRVWVRRFSREKKNRENLKATTGNTQIFVLHLRWCLQLSPLTGKLQQRGSTLTVFFHRLALSLFIFQKTLLQSPVFRFLPLHQMYIIIVMIVLLILISKTSILGIRFRI